MPESVLRNRVVDRAKRRGWKVAHAYPTFVPSKDGEGGQWLTPMMRGWPDLTLMKAGHRIIFIETKKELGDFEEGQLELLQLLNKTGNRAIVVRPSDLREGRVNTILTKGSPIGS